MIGGLNTVLSAVYYIKVLKVMILDRPLEEVEGQPSTPLPRAGRLGCLRLAAGRRDLGRRHLWDPLARASDDGAESLQQRTPRRPWPANRTEGGRDRSPAMPLLRSVIRREGRSLLQYVSEAFPWTTPASPIAGEASAAWPPRSATPSRALMRFLRRQHATPPYLGAFPMGFTTINFVSLDHLLPLLVDEQRPRAIADLERDLAAADAGCRGAELDRAPGAQAAPPARH